MAKEPNKFSKAREALKAGKYKDDAEVSALVRQKNKIMWGSFFFIIVGIAVFFYQISFMPKASWMLIVALVIFLWGTKQQRRSNQVRLKILTTVIEKEGL